MTSEPEVPWSTQHARPPPPLPRGCYLGHAVFLPASASGLILSYLAGSGPIVEAQKGMVGQEGFWLSCSEGADPLVDDGLGAKG